METSLVVALVLAFLLFLLILGVPIGISMGIAGFLGLVALRGEVAAFNSLATLPYRVPATYLYTVVPSFLLMGYLAHYAGLAEDAYIVASKWMGGLPGGIGIATQLAGAAFGAACGSSVAGSVAIGKIALPELRKAGYDIRLATGSIAAAGTLSVMIPPSLWLMLYGIVTEQSVGKLFIAGILPGILAAMSYALLIFIWVKWSRGLVGGVTRSSWKERFISLRLGFPILALAMLVMGGLYTGMFGPTEAGAVGAVGAALLALSRRRLSRRALADSLLETAKSTSMIFFILVGANIFVQFIAISRLPTIFSEFIADAGLSPMVFLTLILLLYLILGMFMDLLAMMVLTLPFIYHILPVMGFDPIWFGIITVMMGAMGAFTPPFGLTVFAVKSIAPDVPLTTIFQGAMVFILPASLTIALLILFPQIALFLPSLMLN